MTGPPDRRARTVTMPFPADPTIVDEPAAPTIHARMREMEG
ncbi:hypothetical protein [Actinomadura sp. 3N407]